MKVFVIWLISKGNNLLMRHFFSLPNRCKEWNAQCCAVSKKTWSKVNSCTHRIIHFLKICLWFCIILKMPIVDEVLKTKKHNQTRMCDSQFCFLCPPPPKCQRKKKNTLQNQQAASINNDATPWFCPPLLHNPELIATTHKWKRWR